LTWINAPPAPDAFLFVSVPPASGLHAGKAGALLAIERGTSIEDDSIEVWRSADGAQTWNQAGRLPSVPGADLITSRDVLIGPDGHMYVAIVRSGPARGWVYRTTEPVVVANEPSLEIPEEESSLRVYPNPATDFITVETDADEVQSLDVLGRVILRAKSNEQVDISSLPAGVYLIQVGNQLRRFSVVR
ncbi:MAG: T9SS type A sorting domain-containing protein, partial [Rubricoccaceae bacterium]|nr:T9SS type A sorting domain-containing protein [Rubricoccaceae bacterium]